MFSARPLFSASLALIALLTLCKPLLYANEEATTILNQTSLESQLPKDTTHPEEPVDNTQLQEDNDNSQSQENSISLKPLKKNKSKENPTQSDRILTALQNEPAMPLKIIPAPIIEEDPADLYLNFEGATLASVVNYLVEQRKINILPKNDLDGIKVSLSTRNGITLKKAWDILLSLLAMNGFTMINVDNLYRIVPVTNHTSEPLPIYSSAAGIMPEDLPNSDLIIRYIMFLKNIKAAVAKGILDPMLTGDKAVQINESLDTLIITERSLNIKAAMKIIVELEQGGLRESIKIIPLEYVTPESIAKLFNEDVLDNREKSPVENIRLLATAGQKKASYFSTKVRIMPYAPKSSLILMGQETEINRIRDFIYKFLDIPMDKAECRLRIKEINYHNADELKKLLDGIIAPLPGIDAKVLAPGGYKVFEDVVIAAESPKNAEDANYGSGNRLIISCGKDDWKRLEKIIDQLDKPEPQVALEVMIVDINSQTEKDLSAQLRLRRAGMIGKDIDFQAATLSGIVGSPSTDPTSLRGDLGVLAQGDATNGGNTALSFGPKGDAWAFIRSIINSTNSNIISQPFLITNNRQACDITSNENRLYFGPVDSTSNTAVQKRVPQLAANTIKITPRINTDGIVDLSINIDIGDFIGTIAGNTTKRTLQTRVQMGIGEVLVLGGLTKSTVTEEMTSTPILSSIPIFGNLFKGKSKSKKDENLYLFLRVSVIKPQREGKPDDYTQLKLDYAKRQVLGVDTYAQSKDPIQRWFFKPSKHTVAKTVQNIKDGKFAPIDNFAECKKCPSGGNPTYDQFYRSENTIKDEYEKRQRLSSQKNNYTLNSLPKLSLKQRSASMTS